MERLTKWEDGSITYNEKREFECGEFCDSCSHGAGDCKTIENMIKKLATYEDLEEQGLLVILPCKIGDTVWVITHPMNVDDSVYSDENLQIFESYVSSVTIYDDSRQYRIHDKKTRNPIIAYFQDRDFGEFIFLTREEAEKKLEEMKNGKK